MANISHKPMPSTFSAGCFSYTSSMKWCLQELHKTSPTKPCPKLCGMFLLHIQAQMVPMANISHKPMPRTLSMGCFSCTSRLKWCLQELNPQTSAQYAIYKMFLLHIQAEMVPIANISHKPMPTTLSMGCFSSTSRLKWCLQELLPQTSSQNAIYRMFLLHIQTEIVPTGTPFKNQCSVCYIQAVSYTHLRAHETL